MISSTGPLPEPWVLENWRASLDRDLQHAFEFPLFTDAWITGGPITIGPYLFINTIAHAGMPVNSLKPAVVVRVSVHLEWALPKMDATDLGSYHGGSFTDEIAALASLTIGIRLKGGAITRQFAPDSSDPLGTPIAYEGYGEPAFVTGASEWILPSAKGAHALGDLEVLELLPRMTPAGVIALLRAARLYQESVWLCVAEPSIAWLLMASAVECAANHWSQEIESPSERLRRSKPRLAKLIEQRCPDLLLDVANEFSQVFGATQKFIKFLLWFLPESPAIRPPAGLQVSWSKKNLRSILNKIYNYRSQALHAGVPFPVPMCKPPRLLHNATAPEEKPLSLATSALGGVWLAADVPMHFHTFEYLVRGALLNWCRFLASEGPDRSGSKS